MNVHEKRQVVLTAIRYSGDPEELLEEMGATSTYINQSSNLSDLEGYRKVLTGRGINTWEEEKDAPPPDPETDPKECEPKGCNPDGTGAGGVDTYQLGKEKEPHKDPLAKMREAMEEMLHTPAASQEAMDEMKAALESVEAKNLDLKEDFEYIKGEFKSARSDMVDAAAKVDDTANKVDTIVAEIAIAVTTVKEMSGKLEDRLKTIMDSFTSADPPVRRRVARAISAATGVASDNEAWLEKFAFPGDARMPVEFSGEPGCSKTYDAERWIRKFDHHVLIQGHEALRTIDMLGGYLPSPSGGFEWQEGDITSAFRAAAHGKTSAMLMDERNRISRGILSVLCSALVPRYNLEDEKCYVLKSGRKVENDEGMKVMEEIWAPCHMLAIIATSNEGRGYNVTIDDAAERARWMIKRVSYDEKSVALILEASLKGLGWDTSYAKKLADFATKGRECVFKNSTLKNPPTLRHLCQAIDNALHADKIGVELEAIAHAQFCGLDSHNMVDVGQIGVVKSLLISTGLKGS